MNAETETNDRNRERFSATINGQTVYFGDPVPDARQILNAANLHAGR